MSFDPVEFDKGRKYINNNCFINENEVNRVENTEDVDDISIFGTEDSSYYSDYDCSDSVSLEQKETDKDILGIKVLNVLNIDSDAKIILEDGSSIAVNDYTNYILSQQVGFETQQEYQQYIIDKLTANLEEMKATYQPQKDAGGFFSNLYDGAKELLGIGTSSKDVEENIAKYEAIINAFTQAMNGKGEMSFAQAYEEYTGNSFSTEQIDEYMNASNLYSALMVGLQYDENYLQKFEKATGKSADDVMKAYAQSQLDTFGESSEVKGIIDNYVQDKQSYSDKLSTIATTAGMACIVTGAVVSFLFPPAAPVGMALMSAGKGISLAGMFVDNAIDLVDNATDSDGLTTDELKDLALETGVEVVSYGVGRKIGMFTNSVNSSVTSKIASKEASELTSKVIGQAAETSLDMALSLGVDYAITQGQSFITTGDFVDSDEYWSMDRFLGEGKNQLMGILTGLASSKVNVYQQSMISTAQTKILSGDVDGAKSYLESSGMKMTDGDFEKFKKMVQEVQSETLTMQKIDEVEMPIKEQIKSEDTNTEQPKIEIPNRSLKYQDVPYEEKLKIVEDTIEDKYLAQKFSTYSDEKLSQVLELKDMGLSEKEILWSVQNNLSQEQFNTFAYLLDSGYSQTDAIYMSSIEPNKLVTAMELKTKGLKSPNIKRVLELNETEYSRAIELVSLGVKDSTILEYVKLDDKAYSRVVELNKLGLDNVSDCYEINRRLSLSDEDFNAEIKKLQHIKSMLITSDTPSNIKQIELSQTEKQELVDFLNRYKNICSIDDSIKDLAWLWVKDYRSSQYASNVLSPKIEDAMILQQQRYILPENTRFTKSMGSTIELSGSVLSRWMRVDDLNSFIAQMPKVGEIYSPNRIQSFSTNLHSAETIFNDFSENNIKFVVYSPNKTTSAFQIENKYNAGCEVLYPSLQKYRVLYKGMEDFPVDVRGTSIDGVNKKFVVYLQEVDSTVAEKSLKFFDPKLSLKTNYELSAQAIILNDKYSQHIGEVEAETRTRFSGIETVDDTNITARVKSDKSIFEKLSSKIQNEKLKSTDYDDCMEAIGDAYGTRIQMNSIDINVAKTKITEILDGTGITYEQFVKHITGEVEYGTATKQKINEIKVSVLDMLKTEQSQAVVDRITQLITDADPNKPPVITELNNYGGTVSSYFTDAQLEKIVTVYSEKYGKPLDVVTKLNETNLPSGRLEIKEKDGRKILSVENSKAKYTDKGAIKDSGYTSSQMNTKHELSDGTVGNGELQIRGIEVNSFADVEHIPYDIRQGKIKSTEEKYKDIYNLIKEMDAETYIAYNQYLTAVYDTLRLKELGIPVNYKPDIKTYMKNSGFTGNDLALLSKEGLEKSIRASKL